MTGSMRHMPPASRSYINPPRRGGRLPQFAYPLDRAFLIDSLAPTMMSMTLRMAFPAGDGLLM